LRGRSSFNVFFKKKAIQLIENSILKIEYISICVFYFKINKIEFECKLKSLKELKDGCLLFKLTKTIMMNATKQEDLLLDLNSSAW